MDFIILKVNGQDVSNSSHEDAVRCFQSAQEPIIVEVLRRQSSGMATAATTPAPTSTHKEQQQQTTTGTPASGSEQESYEQPEQRLQSSTTSNHGSNSFTLLVSTGVQTDWAGLIEDDDFMPVTLHADEQTNDSLDDILAHDIDFEEVTLRKAGSAEKLGLTVCYSSGSGSEDADTEVYISEIVPESLAARDGRLREGDQILRVNGKDVANKEQTENLFAETKNSVTILVSRCLYPEDDYDDRQTYHECSPSLSPEATTPAYQNSIIEQLIRQQQEMDELIPTKESELSNALPPPPVPSHTPVPPPPVAFSNPSSTCSSHSGSHKSGGEPEQPQQQQRKQWMQEAVKECVKRVDGMSIGCPKIAGSGTNTLAMQQATTTSQQQQQAVKLVEAYSRHVWSDTEHIYETIPESDSEPIYSSPYEHQHWLRHPNNNHQRNVSSNQTMPSASAVASGKQWHSSSKSNSSGEEKDSSSAYNTGESCNSNTLTLELQQPSEHRGSTLVLSPPKPTSGALATSIPKMHCNCPVPLTPSSKLSKNQISRRGWQQEQQQQQQPQQQSSVLAAETMYTNVANLQQTMRLQQQLFKQALSRRKAGGSRESCYTRRSRAPSFQAPNLAQYQFVASHQVCGATTALAGSQNKSQRQHQQQQHDRSDAVQMEWKVKRRSDGTRYIARRPVRNRILRNRALRINEERQGHTTEDDAMSEIKIGRYWSKEERKKQLERAKERKQRQQELLQQQMQENNEQLICDYTEESKSLKKSINTIEQNYKKTAKKKPPIEGFTTVQEMLVYGNRVGSSNNQNNAGKLMGLLSVTTV